MSANSDLIPVKEAAPDLIQAQEEQKEWWQAPDSQALPYCHRIMIVRVPHEDDEDLETLFSKAVRLLCQERVCFFGLKMAVPHRGKLTGARSYCIEKPRCQ